ncbi:Alpha-D-GlcNAc alpha-1,2-L-rhamnosyltransferase [hydrothermal vent metagenome]|uniref:Alpha-D-GlcNAc alpha-1,2-L-rhamnosyltransferase n=1 Tax=hydrothermal vent metagenome TaxID=652676 RepID=A0A3B0W2I9_9ZZZZ
MKIFVTGTRGVPDIPGGVETHCQNLYPHIAAAGHEVHISRRTPYVTDELKDWQGIYLHDVFAPKSKALEAIIHTFLSVIKARQLNVDIVHIHAVGPALLIPFARLLGLKVVFTNHGPDYDRQKWSRLPKAVLKLGEYMGGKFSNTNIVISEVIRQIVGQRCKRDSVIIYNGVNINETNSCGDYLKSIGVKKNNYILAVARFVPEKGLHDLIAAYARSGKNYDLVIAGDADHEDEYSQSLKQLAKENGVKLTGYIGGDTLHQVFSHAALFVLPSYHEGLPIALLEALGYGLNVLVSDIPANLEVKLDKPHFFECGNVAALCDGMDLLLAQGTNEAYRQEITTMLNTLYNWEKIAKQTVLEYEKLY